MWKQLTFLASALAAVLMLATGPAGAEGNRADDSGRNVRDKGNATLTPEDQLQNESDIRITSDIRKAINDDKSFSVNAHNVKVITRNGMVTLRGPVDSEAETARLQAIAQQASGVTQVNNQLEVRTP